MGGGLFYKVDRFHCGSSSVGRALAFQAKGREFEPRLPLERDNVRLREAIQGEIGFDVVCFG